MRTTTRIAGFRSGLRAAGEEFIFGIYDGTTGLVLQPYHGAKERGALGFLAGVGKGIGGFILKDLAAITGPVAYILKGIYKETTKSKQPTAFIRQARMFQGRKDVEAQSEGSLQRSEETVDAAWRIIREVKKEMEVNGKEGLLGRFRAKQEQRRMRRQGAFKGSVWGADKVIEERKKSRSREEVR